MTEQYKCPSYYDDNNVLQDCICGKCGEENTQPEPPQGELRGQLMALLEEAMSPHDWAVEDPTPQQVADTILKQFAQREQEARIDELEGLLISRPGIGPNGENMGVNLPDHPAIWRRITDRLKALRAHPNTTGDK